MTKDQAQEMLESGGGDDDSEEDEEEPDDRFTFIRRTEGLEKSELAKLLKACTCAGEGGKGRGEDCQCGGWLAGVHASPRTRDDGAPATA